jgi:hypothetical protein
MKPLNIKVEITLPAASDKLFGDREPVSIEQTPSAPELAEANEQLRQINRDIRDHDGRNVKTIKDMLER